MVARGYKDTKIGVIPVEWDVVELRDIGKVSMCKRIMKNETTDYEKIPFYKIGTFGKEADAYISKEVYEEYKNKYSFPKQGDILISASGTIGRLVVYNGEPAYFQDSNIVWIDNQEDKLLNSFLLYVYKTVKWHTDGNTIARLYNENLRKIKIPLPPLKEQEKIADILSTADDKIDVIAIQIEKAQTLKKGLLQKLLSEGIGHNEFKDSELGKIPEGWEVGKLENILTIKYGKSQKYVEDINGDYPILGTGGIMGYANNYLSNKPSVLIGRKGTIDKPQYMETPFWTVDTLFYTELKKDIYPKFVYYTFQTIPWKKYNEASGVPSLSKPNIHNIATVLLPFKEQKQIAEILSTADEKLEVLKAKKEKYETLKKGLLQKLLSGEVRTV